MALEINRNSKYTYQIDPDDPRLINRRENRHNARWKPFRLLPSATEAKLVLLRLNRNGEAPKDES